MPQPKSISPGKGREALRKKVQISRLKYGMAFDFQISDHRQRTQENWSESTRFR